MNRTLDTVAPRRLRGLLAAAALVAGVASQASAQITFAGTTQFQFNGVGGFANSQTFKGLTLGTGSFTVTTNGPGDPQSFGGTGNNAGLASLVVNSPPFNFTLAGTTLQMLITFSTPTVLNQTFNALVTGKVLTTANGVTIAWSPPSISNIPFSLGSTSGTFDIKMNDVGVNVGSTGAQQISGRIVEQTEVTTSPEPASLVLLGTGLVGVIGVAARRRKA